MPRPITSLGVVQQTLKTAQECAKECKQPYAFATYDLAAAKPAMRIQSSQAPKFDNIMILMSAFHTEMAFFKALGKLVSESGGPAILTEAGVLAPAAP